MKQRGKPSKKRPRADDDHNDGAFFAVAPNNVNTQLAAHVQSRMVQSAHFDKELGAYRYVKHGQMISSSGLHKALFWRYYRHYKDNRSKRKWSTGIKGSSDKRGIRIDREITSYVASGGTRPARPDVLTTAILDHIESLGHTPQGAQIPVEIPGWMRMTQVDFVSCDPHGRLHVWEVKSGIPVGGFVQQGFFKEIRDASNGGHPVKCTKYHIWQLQLYYESKSLEAAGVPVYQQHIIQAYEDRKKGIIVKVHDPPPWTANIPPLELEAHVAAVPPPRKEPLVIDLT